LSPQHPLSGLYIARHPLPFIDRFPAMLAMTIPVIISAHIRLQTI
jgi:hypothetical protein